MEYKIFMRGRGDMMRILCRNRGCAYYQLGECTLTQAARAGTGGDACAYYIKRQEE